MTGMNEITFSWTSVSLLDEYYEYTFQVLNTSTIITNTTINNSVIFLDIPYYMNFTFLVSVHNCIGESAPANISNIMIGK